MSFLKATHCLPEPHRINMALLTNSEPFDFRGSMNAGTFWGAIAIQNLPKKGGAKAVS